MSAFLWDVRIIIFGIVIAWVIFGIVFRMVPSVIWFIPVVWMMIFVIIVFRGRTAFFFRFLFRFFTLGTFGISFWAFAGSGKPSTIQHVRRQSNRTTRHLLDFELNLEKNYYERGLCFLTTYHINVHKLGKNFWYRHWISFSTIYR